MFGGAGGGGDMCVCVCVGWVGVEKGEIGGGALDKEIFLPYIKLNVQKGCGEICVCGEGGWGRREKLEAGRVGQGDISIERIGCHILY